jgi:hypothetical protein
MGIFFLRAFLLVSFGLVEISLAWDTPLLE